MVASNPETSDRLCWAVTETKVKCKLGSSVLKYIAKLKSSVVNTKVTELFICYKFIFKECYQV